MITAVPAKARFLVKEGWLQSYHHFSFDTYFDPQNMHHGALRVFNDDTIAPGGKFGMHPHANFEIITIVLSGTVEHADSGGHAGTTSADEVQVMSAGRGIFHSEANSCRAALHLLQI